MPKKKAGKKNKVSNANKQRQAVNVKIKIDQSRRTNPREPRQVAKSSSLPSRSYTANSSTPLHTTIMTATPYPAIIHNPPNPPNSSNPPGPPNPPNDDRNDRITRMIDDLDFRTNRQLNLLTDDLGRRFNEIVRVQQPPPQQPSIPELYNAMLKEYNARQPRQLPQGFQDPNARVATKLKTPVKAESKEDDGQSPSIPRKRNEAEEGSSEEKEEKELKEEKDESQVPVAPPKKRRGRPQISEEEKAYRKAMKKEQKRQEEIFKKIRNTRANQQAGLASPLASGLPEPVRKRSATSHLPLQDIPEGQSLITSYFSPTQLKNLTEPPERIKFSKSRIATRLNFPSEEGIILG